MRQFLLLVAFAIAGTAIAATAGVELSGTKPNVILILVDDMGYADMSATGNPVIQTPNMDRIYREGRRFTDFHVSPTCAPTRSALLTGRHEFRNGITHTILERERLRPDAVTLAQVLKDAGYRTGIFGKWHLGDERPYWPTARGFDEMFIHGAGGIGQTYEGSCGDAPGNTYFSPAILHNGTFEKTSGYCTDVFFKQALTWMEHVKNSGPFYCHLATNAPHGPLQVRPEDERRYAGKTAPDAAKFFGMIANIDDNIGILLAKLDEWKIADHTLVVLMNDNGGTVGCKVFNAGMRGQKSTPFLGGTRAYSLWRWPGKIDSGDCGALTAHIDFFPTIAALAGAKLSGKVTEQVEGRSLVPLLENPDAGWADRTLFTHVGRWPKGADPATGKYMGCSVRSPEWHLVSPIAQREKEDPASPPKWMLFDVKVDYGEKHDVAKEHPEVVSRMAQQFEDWWTSVQPDFVNEKAVGPAVNTFKQIYWEQFGKPEPPKQK